MKQKFNEVFYKSCPKCSCLITINLNETTPSKDNMMNSTFKASNSKTRTSFEPTKNSTFNTSSSKTRTTFEPKKNDATFDINNPQHVNINTCPNKAGAPVKSNSSKEIGQKSKRRDRTSVSKPKVRNNASSQTSDLVFNTLEPQVPLIYRETITRKVPEANTVTLPKDLLQNILSTKSFSHEFDNLKAFIKNETLITSRNNEAILNDLSRQRREIRELQDLVNNFIKQNRNNSKQNRILNKKNYKSSSSYTSKSSIVTMVDKSVPCFEEEPFYRRWYNSLRRPFRN